MKTIGLLGGMSWESTVVYYQHLNQQARVELGGLHSAAILMWSCDFAQIEALQAKGDWDEAGAILAQAAKNLEVAGAQCMLICTNTMHKLADQVQSAINIPLIHIADATAGAIHQTQVQQPLLLATRYTMEQEFYKGYLTDNHNIRVQTPNAAGRTQVHNIIYDELCQGVVKDESRTSYLNIIEQSCADGVIFGCTEVGLLLSADDISVPVFDSTRIHAEAAMQFALSG